MSSHWLDYRLVFGLNINQKWVAATSFYIALAFFALYLTSKLQVVFSRLLNFFLCSYYTIRHVRTGRQLPTCPYEWPNGQGNVAKFLDGLKNSNVWGKQHGSLYRIWSGMTSEIVLTTPEHIKSVFRDSDKHFKAVDNNSGFFMHEILGQCVGLISGAKWKAVKTAVEIPFIHQNIRNHVSSVQRHTKEYFKVLEGKGNLSKRKLDPVADIKMLPFWIIVDIIYGGLSPGMEAQLCKLAPQREELFKFVIHGGLTRFWFSRLLPLKANKELKAFKHDWKAFNDSAYRHALELGIKTPFVSMHHAIERGEISEDQLLQTLDEMIFANLDVTMGGISWNLVFLAANPHIQDQLRDEIGEQRSLAAIDVEKFNNYLVSSSSLLAACVLESARLKPLAAFSVPQAAPTDRIIDGYRIPALTNFLVDTCALNITNPFWGPDSTIYRPGRFLERKGPELRYNYWRFGFGPRQCMGKYVADLIIHSILVHTLENYTLRTEATAEDWKWVMDTWINNPDIILHCEARKKVGLPH